VDTEKTVWNRRPDFGKIWNVPFRRLDDRIRELCSALTSAKEYELLPLISELKSALRQRTETVRKLAAAKLARPGYQEPQEGRCQRSTHPDGRVFWSFTWSPPVQKTMPSVPNSSICNRPAQLEIGNANEDSIVANVQPLMSAEQNPPVAQRAA